MTSEPPEEAISSFISFTNTSRQQAISFLRANDLDSHKAINAYFEDPTGPQTQTTGYQDDSGVSVYQIEHSDAVPVSPNLPPLSRPPSASNLKDSTRSTELPLTQTTAPAQNTTGTTPGNGLTLAEQEERQLQQAVAMSLNQDLGQQETGVTSANQKFNRATRDYYEEGDWAMTLFNSSTREIAISPDPADRKRQGNEPPFIRPSQDTLYLSGLITVLHSIPLAREALLFRNRVLSNYGHDSQWWNGQPINLPKIVTIHEAQNGDTDWDDIIYETQRLVAFLDSTNRAFGSVDALGGLSCLSSYDAEGGISRFLEAWQESAVRADPGNQLATVFSSMAYKRPLSEFDTPIDKEFFTLEPCVGSDHGQTLYDVLDATMWSDSPGEDLDDVWLEHVADVLTIKLDGADGSRSVDVKIPAAFYPDRYLASCRDIAREYRTQRLIIREDILKLQSLMNRFSASSNSSSELTSKEILERAAAAALTIPPQDDSNDVPGSTIAEESTTMAQQLAVKLKAVSEKIENKLQELETRKQKAMESVRSYSKFLTEPSSEPSDPPVYRYTLRGVCTEPHVTYVLRHPMPLNNTDENAVNARAGSTSDYEWWRISFSTDDAKTRQAESGQSTSGPKNADVIGYTARKVREVEVLRAAREAPKSVLLVYANSNAMSFGEEPAPSPLRDFVNADNNAFEAELEASHNAERPRQAQREDTWEQTVGTRPAFPSPSLNEEEIQQQSSVGTDGTRKVNVFDYQVSSFEDDSAGQGQEMQERGGRPLLSGSASRPVQPLENNPPWSQ